MDLSDERVWLECPVEVAVTGLVFDIALPSRVGSLLIVCRPKLRNRRNAGEPTSCRAAGYGAYRKHAYVGHFQSEPVS
jgi:hypothetical protein